MPLPHLLVLLGLFFALKIAAIVFFARRARRYRTAPRVIHHTSAADGGLNLTISVDGVPFRIAQAYAETLDPSPILFTTAGRFRPHESISGRWVCVRDPRRTAEFRAVPSPAAAPFTSGDSSSPSA